LLCLAGCGGGPGSPNGSGGGLLSTTSGWFTSTKKIAVAPIIGAPQSVADQLTEALVVAGKDRKLVLIPGGGGGANYTLRGYLLASSERGGTKISYIWDVTDAKGARAARVSGDEMIAGRSGDPWSKLDGAAIRSIAGKTTSQLAAALQGRGSSAPVAVSEAPTPSPTPAPAAAAGPAAPAATASVAKPRSNGVVVAPVQGAPGDGQRSLATALKKRLYAGGVKLANGVTTNVYTVKGTVKLADASGGKQNIRIDWLVVDPNGKRLGTVTQQNTIPRGSLNGPWGAIADAAAGAAANGILKLLPKSS
jgi:hypothetical protein